jgi:hypothetical protein
MLQPVDATAQFGRTNTLRRPFELGEATYKKIFADFGAVSCS